MVLYGCGSYPVHVWRNADTKQLRIDTYGGVNSLVGSKVVPNPALVLSQFDLLSRNITGCLGAGVTIPSHSKTGPTDLLRLC